MKSCWTILPLLARVSRTGRHHGVSSSGYSATLEREGGGTSRAVVWSSGTKREVTQGERQAASRAGAMGTGTRTTGTRARTTASGKREIEETAGGSATSSQKTSRPFPEAPDVIAQPEGHGRLHGTRHEEGISISVPCVLARCNNRCTAFESIPSLCRESPRGLRVLPRSAVLRVGESIAFHPRSSWISFLLHLKVGRDLSSTVLRPIVY
jgi:hypothetical protein